MVLRGGHGWSKDVTRQGALSPDVSFKDIWDLGVAYRKFGWLRLEGEFSYIHANIDDVVRGDGASLNGSGQDRHYVLMVNAFADWHNTSPFTPFAGLGPERPTYTMTCALCGPGATTSSPLMTMPGALPTSSWPGSPGRSTPAGPWS